MMAHQGNAAPWVKRHELWSLREDVSVESGPGEGPLRLRGRWGDVTVRQPSGVVREALTRMSLGPVSLENVMGGSGSGAVQAQREHLYQVLEHLEPLIIRSLRLESGDPLLSVVPLAVHSQFRPAPLEAGVPVRLSAYAQLRTDGREASIESPLALHRVVLHRAEAVRLIAPLISPITPAGYVAAVSPLDLLVPDVLEYLAAAGMVVAAQRSADNALIFAEESDPAIVGWSPVDMMFHTRSTLGRHDHDFGVTRAVSGAVPGEPVGGRPRTGGHVPLHRPRWEDLRATDPPLTAVIEGRRSERSHGADQVSVMQIGELLYRAARVRSVGPGALGDSADASGPGEAGEEAVRSDRPYPSGGSAFELELYLTIGECAGLDRGVYHYDPVGHCLEPVSADRVAAEEILADARVAAGAAALPPVLITMTARFHRLSWRYEGLAYRLVLMNAGALMQNLYLVSTAMRLAPCAIGTVSIDTVARAFGTDWRVEPCVGQFMVGSQPAVPASGSRHAWRDLNDGWWADAGRAIQEPPRILELLRIAVIPVLSRQLPAAAVTVESVNESALVSAVGCLTHSGASYANNAGGQAALPNFLARPIGSHIRTARVLRV
jgi:SagB-type dehydrogenase family enzyme